MFRRYAGISMLLACSMSLSAEARDTIRIGLNDATGGGATGRVIVVDDEDGPDALSMRVRGLQPNTIYTFFLAQSPTLGALPVQFVGEFTTNRRGVGRLFAITEVIDAYATANQALEDGLGVADVQGAGALASGANAIALDWFRVYVGVGDISVFGRSDAAMGGGLALTGANALP